MARCEAVLCRVMEFGVIWLITLDNPYSTLPNNSFLTTKFSQALPTFVLLSAGFSSLLPTTFSSILWPLLCHTGILLSIPPLLLSLLILAHLSWNCFDYARPLLPHTTHTQYHFLLTHFANVLREIPICRSNGKHTICSENRIRTLSRWAGGRGLHTHLIFSVLVC